MSRTLKRVGLLGGTFDPPTRAHLEVAGRARGALGLDAVWLVPALGAHKNPVASGEHRLAMCQEAVAGWDGVEVCDVDLAGRLARSVDTLSALVELWPLVEFTFLVGDDINVEAWAEWGRCREMARFVRIARGGQLRFDGGLDRIDLGNHSHSSTRSRTLAAMRVADDSLPAPVARYIEVHGLYTQSLSHQQHQMVS